MNKLINAGILVCVFLVTTTIANASMVCLQTNKAGQCVQWGTPEEANMLFKQMVGKDGEDFYKKLNDYMKPPTAQEKAKSEAQQKAEKAVEAKAEAKKNAILANTILIGKKIDSYDESLNKLSNKKQLGVPINEAEYNLLNYKLELLQNLQPKLTTSTGYYATMSDKYDEAILAYNNKTITLEECQALIAKLKTQDESLKTPYEQIIAIEVMPNQAKIKNIVQQATGTENQTGNFTYSEPTSALFKVRNKIDEVNNVTNSINNGLFQLKGLTRY